MRKITLVVFLGVFVYGLAVLLGIFYPTSTEPQVKHPLEPAAMQQLVSKGRALALAGDCLGCHSQATGPQAAGGVPLNTPFGTVYSSNISPDKTYGIGNYTREDFHRVLRDGIAPNNKNLYPAMPYVYTHMASSDDIDAIYAYLMSLEPMKVPNKSNTGVFMLPVRPFMNFWNLLNFPKRNPPSIDNGSELWARGAYLTEGLAHCAACHTPFNFMMGNDFARNLQGSEIDGLETPDITAQSLAKLGYDVATLSRYLQTGIAPQGTSFASMNTVTHFSTSAMDPEDVWAMASYLLSDENGKLIKPAARPLEAGAGAAETLPMTTGYMVYLNACAGCHALAGEGIPNVSPAMSGNAILAMAGAKDTIKVILEGIPSQAFTGDMRMYAMPPFAHVLTDADIASLVNWMRKQWGGQSNEISPEDVRKMSQQLPAVRSR